MKRLILLLAACLPLHAATYYIAVGGSDAANGTTKGTAWAHAPGMATCANVCASTTPVAGDSIIFKGGDTWLNVNFPMNWFWSGTSGNRITIGVDVTWYTGTSWSRPIFDAGGAMMSGAANRFISLSSGLSYITIDHLEMKNFYWSGKQPFAHDVYILVGDATYVTLSNLYLHSWSHDTPEGCNNDCDNLNVILGTSTGTYNAGSVLTNSIIDGAPSGGDSARVVYCFPTVTNSIIRNTSNGILYSVGGEISGNHIYNINGSYDPGMHENAMEAVTGSGTTYIFNNVVHAVIGEALYMGAVAGEIDYVWNNVFYDITGAGPDIDGDKGSQELYFWNNTVVPAVGSWCLRQPRAGTITGYVQNNLCITTGATPLTVTGPTTDHNVVLTPTEATAHGYTSSQSPYVYFPTAGGSTIGAGANLTASCSGSNAALCSDTTYAGGRAPVARPTSGAWDIGAYQYASGATTSSVITSGPLRITGGVKTQ